MEKITVKIDGMMCGMCESHVNDAIRNAFPVKKVTSSHSKGETVIISVEALSEDKIREVMQRSRLTLTQNPKSSIRK